MIVNHFFKKLVARTAGFVTLGLAASLALAQTTITTKPVPGYGVRVTRVNTKKFFPQVSRALPKGLGAFGKIFSDLSPPSHFRPFAGGNRPNLSAASGGVTAQGLNFIGLNETKITTGIQFPGQSGAPGTWPDATIAVGPKYIVQTVNSQIAFYDKADGSLVFQQSLDDMGFFNQFILPTTFQPRCFYDQVSQRFFVIALNADFVGSTSVMAVAVSQTSDPNGLWASYLFDSTYYTVSRGTPVSYYFVSPSFGYNKDYAVVGGLVRNRSLGNLGQIIALNKSDLMNARDRVRTGSFITGTSPIQMARSLDQGMRGTFGASTRGGAALAIFNVRDDQGSPLLSEFRLSTAPFFRSIGYAYTAPFGANVLRNLSGTLMDAAVYDGDFVTATTGAVFDPFLGERSTVRWMHINMRDWPFQGAPQYMESGNIEPISPNETLMPAISINSLRDISVLYTETSYQNGPLLKVVGRKLTDPSGTMGVPTTLVQSPDPAIVATTAIVFGTYGMVAIDPNDGITFWGTHELLNPDLSWGTQIARWTVSTGGSTQTTYNPGSVTPVLGKFVAGTPASFTAVDGDLYSLSSVTMKNGEYASYDLNYTITQAAANVIKMDFNVQLNVNPGDPTPGYVYFLNQKTGLFDLIRTLRVPMVDSQLFTASVPVDASVYVSPSKSVTVRFTGFQPYRRFGRAATPFTLNTDLGQLVVNQIN